MSDLSSIRQRIERTMSQPNLPSILELQEQMQPHVSDISEVLRRYSDLVDTFYEKNNPFVSQDNIQDLTDFIQLIGFSTIVGSYFLLEKWCIQRLQVNKLARPLSYYISKLQELYDNPNAFGLQAEARPYVKYLINRMRR